MITAYINKRLSNWEDLLPIVEFAYNTTPHASTGYSPFRLNSGREAIIPATLHNPNQLPQNDVNKFLLDYHTALADAREHLMQANLATALKTTQRKAHTFRIGDLVKLSTEHLGKKHKPAFSDKWAGPFPITAVYGNAVELDLSTIPNLSDVSRQWNVAQVQPYHQRRQDTSELPEIPPHLVAPESSAPTTQTLFAEVHAPTSSTSAMDQPISPRPAFANRDNDIPQGNEDFSPTFDYTPRNDITCFMESRRVRNKLEYRLHTQDADPSLDQWVPVKDIHRHPELRQLLRNYEKFRRQQRVRERQSALLLSSQTPPCPRHRLLLLL
jgi:hypothetical protein